MKSASRISRGDLFLVLVNNSNLSTGPVGMQSLLVMRCLVIAESDVAVFAFVPGARLSNFSGTRCLILSWNICHVLPTYVRSQRHVYLYITLFKAVVGKASLAIPLKLLRVVKATIDLTLGNALLTTLAMSWLICPLIRSPIQGKRTTIGLLGSSGTGCFRGM